MIDRDQTKPTWKNLSRNLKDKGFNQLSITEEPGVNTVLAGVIVEATSKRSPFEDQPFVDANKRLAGIIRDERLSLFGRDILNPALLRDLIDTSILSNHSKHHLRMLLGPLEIYRRHNEDRWWEANIDLMQLGSAEVSLHRLIALNLLTNYDNPANAYRNGVNLVNKVLASSTAKLYDCTDEYKSVLRDYDFPNRIIEQKIDIGEDVPVTLKVPVLKSGPTDPDRIDYAYVVFNRGHIRLLKDLSFRIAMGGSPNSGKSTTAASLVLSLREVVDNCIGEGILNENEFTTGLCDLDLSSATANDILLGKRPERMKRKWTTQMAWDARDAFIDMSERNNIVIGDLPGGEPDEITDILVRPAIYSIIVDKHYREGLKPWKDLFSDPYFPSVIALIHTRLGESGRRSGIRSFQSINRGDKRNYVTGRIVNLEREVKRRDDFIWFFAHWLLFDALPSFRIQKNQYARNLIGTLNLN